MRALLQKSCKSCTASSIETYYYTIRSLAKLVGRDEVPLDDRWINDTMFERVTNQPKITSSKNLAVAAIKALRVYARSTCQKETREMGKVRHQGEREVLKGPEQAGANHTGNEKLAQGETVVQAPARVSFTELWYLGRWITFVFYSRHALRGDLADLQIRKKGQN